ncbi:folylpolyglutamate synthase/dihydrofolate synthase family protein [Thalassospira sp. TSL5-1]|uniref:bifunctional folylpolyglutamate synthase/dihydrofolate synthase n=1 Tax=Thalassospira sp. TSL5-1 TaxID=1544451 RepID=UPI0009405439|nr:folylpolyglutamate synthase/dihydrofolate synthase family protein [Thalassospira sp. TSL5-1]OKH87442.1 bifunctional folylpolyglutamate synthase/ dihydrofolate synthase [Thalassospira sp. TSL5-1]
MQVPSPRSSAILGRLGLLHPKIIDLSLGRIATLLQKLGNPHLKLPPVIHIAGTNGKGSTLAYLRAIYEAAGLRVHTSTSPHLVTFHERIVLAGQQISEDELCDLLEEVERINDGAQITYFEITQAAAFLAYSRVEADVLLLETGLGGRYDATNVLPNPALSVITPVSIDHQAFLGDTVEKIAFQKAGIMKAGIPCVVAPQMLPAFDVLVRHASKINTPLVTNFAITAEDDDGFDLHIDGEALRLPAPALPGRHQYVNAMVATVAVRNAGIQAKNGDDIDIETISTGLKNARWPARLQRLAQGPLIDLLPDDAELYVDGGHNIAAADVIAKWLERAHANGDTVVVMGMLNNRDPLAFLRPLAPHVSGLAAVDIPGEHQAHTPQTLADAAKALNIPATACSDVAHAIETLCNSHPNARRFLILGSLYLAGLVLAENA